MEGRTKQILYACCAAAGLSFLLAIWSLSNAWRARTTAALAKKRATEIEELVGEAKEEAAERRRELDSKLRDLEERANQLSKKLDVVHAGREKAIEYANRKHKDALDMLEERLRAFGRERDEKLKGFSDGMGKARLELEKSVEEKCDKLKGYLDKRLSVY